MTSQAKKRAHPLLWVPSLYFGMGTPMIAISVVAAILYKNLGVSNAEIAAYTGAMYLPWVIKPLWAPVLELFRTKRFFVLLMEGVLAVGFASLALALRLPSFMLPTLVIFWICGFASATQDIAGDGVYITSATAKEQALYMGVQGAFWNLGRVLVSGGLVSLTKILYDSAHAKHPTPEGTVPDPAWQEAWMYIMLLIGGLMGLLLLWHVFVLPEGSKAAKENRSLAQAFSTTADAWVSFFRKPQIGMMITVVFFYRFAEGFIEKIGPLFLLDARSVGGLGLDNMQLGNINGTFGTVSYITGTLVGGAMAAKLNLRKSFIPLALALNVPHVTYFYLSHALPTSVTWITVVVTIEKFGYGMGTVGMMLYMMQQLSPGRYRTAHYAFATGIMALTMMLTGMVSGQLEEWLGYKSFFAFVLVASVPPVVIAYFAPFREYPPEPAEATEP